MSAERVRIEVQLVAGSEPISGTLADDRGRPRPFLGWSELAALIEAARMATTEPKERV
jgi:hypothetical protein